jgi:hypothetical protein
MAVALAGTLATVSVRAQEPVTTREQFQENNSSWDIGENSLLGPGHQPADATTAANTLLSDAPTINAADTSDPIIQGDTQSKRILWIVPNYRAASTDAQLPPLSFKGKTWLATEDTFDYSDFIFVGALAGTSMAQKSEPSFGQGGAGYGRYYWRIFADSGIENYMTEAIVPEITKEDPRYYRLGTGGFFKRTGYAVSRLFITRTDAGKNTFNLSEIVGSGVAAGIGNTYYPTNSNMWVKTYQRWGTQVGLDCEFNLLKEFWPDISHAVFRGKY